MTDAQFTQVGAEVWTDTPNRAHTSQLVGEILAAGTPNARVSQVVAETLSTGTPNARVSQLVTEALTRGTADARCSQLVIEVLQRNYPVTMPPIYPTMAGLAYSVFWTPQFYNQSEVSTGGVNVDAALAQYPTHEFKLSYDFLREQFQYGSLEFQLYMGFFLRMGGQAGRFLFLNPQDNYVQHQAMGTTQSLQAVYTPIVRTFGVGDNVGTEPVGYVDLTRPLNVYLDGILQDRSTYSIISTTPANQQLKFNTTPAAGKVITMDLGYFYYCKFPIDSLTFENFMKGLTLVKEVTLRSCKAGT